MTNPLLRQGLVPPSLAHILIPPPVKPVAAKKRRVLTEGRIISGSEMLLQLKVILALRHRIFFYLVGLTFSVHLLHDFNVSVTQRIGKRQTNRSRSVRLSVKKKEKERQKRRKRRKRNA